MTLKIIHPDGGDQHAIGLDFVDGVAEVKSLEEPARAVLEAHGFKVEQPRKAPSKPKVKAD